MLARQINSSLMYTRYKIVGIDHNDKTYFVEYIEDYDTRKLEYFWCRANQALKIGSQVEGYLCPTEYSDGLATLIVGECNSIVPTINRIALMSN
jgi:hypothetical protein